MVRKTFRAPAGQSAQVSGVTSASVKAMPRTAPGCRCAQSKPSAEPQSCSTKVTRSVAPTSSRKRSRKPAWAEKE